MSFDVQRQIRVNAHETQTYFEDLYKWIDDVKKDDTKKDKAAHGTKMKPEGPTEHVESRVTDQVSLHIAEPIRVPLQGDKEDEEYEIVAQDPLPHPFNKPEPHFSSEPLLPHPPAPANHPVRVIKGTRAVSDEELAVKRKEAGNALVKAQQYREAIAEYDVGIGYLTAGQMMTSSAFPDLLSLLFSNRSLCNIKLGNYSTAIADATAALKADQSNEKAAFRRSQAYAKTGKIKQAIDDLRACKSSEAAIELQKLEKILSIQIESQRDLARRAMTDGLRQGVKKRKKLEYKVVQTSTTYLKEIEPPIVVAPLNKPTYVPKSARLATPSTATSTVPSYTSFARLWFHATDRLEIFSRHEINLSIIMKESLESDLFESMITEFVQWLSREETSDAAIRGLYALSKVRRFDMLISMIKPVLFPPSVEDSLLKSLYEKKSL